MRRYSSIIFPIVIALVLFSCAPDFDIVEDLKHSDYQLLNIDSVHVEFPNLISGKIGIVGYIFTNCPDICPLTTNNMRLVQDILKGSNITGVHFVSISFDPEVDKPSALREFAQIRNLDLSNWDFLTGESSTIDELMKNVGVIAFVGDSTVFEDGRKSYYYTHTDRIQLFDQDGRIRKNYLGSSADIDEIVKDIKQLLD